MALADTFSIEIVMTFSEQLSPEGAIVWRRQWSIQSRFELILSVPGVPKQEHLKNHISSTDILLLLLRFRKMSTVREGSFSSLQWELYSSWCQLEILQFAVGSNYACIFAQANVYWSWLLRSFPLKILTWLPYN